MNLLWLALIPVVLFVSAAVGFAVLEWCFNARKWWGFPLYMAVCVPIFITCIGLIAWCVFAAAGVTLPHGRP